MHNILRNSVRYLFSKNRPVTNRAILALLMISGLYYLANSMLMPIYAIFVEKIGGDVSVAANTYAVFWLTAGLLTLVAGRYESKTGEAVLSIALAQFVLGVGFMFYYFIDSVAMLYFAMVILGIGNAIYWPAFHSVYGKHVDWNNSEIQWSLYDGMAYIVPALAAAAGGWIAGHYGFGVIFLVMAWASFLNGVLIVILFRKTL